MAVRAQRLRILNCIRTTVGELNHVMNLEIRRAIRAAHKRRVIPTHFALTLRAEQHFCNHVCVANELPSLESKS